MSAATRTEKWDRVTRHAPCPICQRTGYCKVTTDGMIAGCMREPDGAYKTVPTALGEMYLHRLTDEPCEPRPVRPKPTEAPQRNVIADRAVYALVVETCASLPPCAVDEMVRRFGPLDPQIATTQRIGYCDGPALLAAIERAGRQREAIDAGVLNQDGTVSRSLLGRLVIPYMRDGLVHDLRGAGIKGRDETKEISLRGGYAERGVADLFYNDDALGQLGPDATLHLAGGAYKTMALLAAGLNAVGLRGEAELSDGHIARLHAAGVRTIIRHIDAEDPKEGQDLSAGRRLGLTVAERLAAAGFAVRMAEPPREPGTPKVDPDALLRDLGPRAVRDYALSAIPLDAWRVVIGVQPVGVPEEVAVEREALRRQLREKDHLISALAGLKRAKQIKAVEPAVFASAVIYASKKSRGQVDSDGWAPTSRAELGDVGGRSPDAIGNQLDTIASWGAGFEKESRYEDFRQVDNAGQVTVERRRRLYIRVNGDVADVLEAFAKVEPPKAMKKNGEEKATWGGKRIPCPRCGGERRRTVVTCADCGLEFSGKVDESTPEMETAAAIPVREEEPQSIPPMSVVVAAPTVTYPPGEETDADEWDPHFCNHIDHHGRQCTARIDPALGKRYCWQHRQATAAAPTTPASAPPGAAACTLGGIRVGPAARTGAPPPPLRAAPERSGDPPPPPVHRPWCLNYQGQDRGCQRRVSRPGERYCAACVAEGFTNGPEAHDAAD